MEAQADRRGVHAARRFTLPGGLSTADPRVRDAAAYSLHVTLATCVPLIVAYAFGVVDYGVYVAFGGMIFAFVVAWVAPGARRQTRMPVLAAASLGMAAGAFVAALVGASPWLTMLALLVMVVPYGYAPVLWASTSAVGLAALYLFLLSVGHPAGITQAALRAGLVLVGAVFALALGLVIPRPAPARRAEQCVGELARSVADELRATARGEPTADLASVVGRRLVAARAQVMRARDAHGTDCRLFHLTQRLVELGRCASTFAAAVEAHPAEDWRAAASRQLLDLAAGVDELAAALDNGTGRPASGPRPDAAAALAPVAAAPDPGPRPGPAVAAASPAAAPGSSAAAPAAARELAQAREELARAWADERGKVPDDCPVPRPAGGAHSTGLRDRLLTHVGRDSTVFRHTVHLTVGALLSVVVYSWVLPVLVPGMPLLATQGYWITMTVILVLQLRYAAMYRKARGRSVGSLLGGVIAVILASAIRDPALLVFLTIPLGALAFFYFPLRYWLFVVFFTPLVIVMMGITQPGDWRLALVRVADTVIGAALAVLVASLILPNRERLFLPERIERALSAAAARLGQLAAGIEQGTDGAAAHDVRGDRSGPRLMLAVLEAEESYERLLSEPAAGRGEAERYGELLLGLRSLATECVVLSHLLDEGQARILPAGAASRAEAAALALREAAAAMAAARPPEVPEPTLAVLRAARDRREAPVTGDICDQTLRLLHVARRVAEAGALDDARPAQGLPVAVAAPGRT